MLATYLVETTASAATTEMQMSSITALTAFGRVFRRHESAERSKEKESLVRIQPMTTAYDSLVLLLIILANLLNTMSASRPIPPHVENTNSVKQPCSISRTRLPYPLFFFVSCCLYSDDYDKL